jgi:AcrR family transcriptional regulator
MVMVPEHRLEGAALFEHPVSLAVIEAIEERGYELVGVEDILERSGMSRGEFERQFRDKADAADRVFVAYIDNFQSRLRAAYATEPRWPDNLRAAAYETARWIRDNPKGTWFGMVGTLDAGDMPRLRREEVLKWCAELIDRGREVAPDPERVSAAASLMAVGAIAETLRRQQEGSFEAGIVETVAPMMYGAVRPYLGEEVALRELEIPPPPDLTPRSEAQ